MSDPAPHQHLAPPPEDSFESIVSRRFARRSFFKGAAAMGVVAVVPMQLAAKCAPAVPAPADLTFLPIAPDATDAVTVPRGYRSDVIVAWGDPLFAADGPFDITRLTSAQQARRVGFNADFVQFLPLPTWGAKEFNRALLWNNHEYTDPKMMFPGLDPATYPTLEQTEIELEAHGGTVIELQRNGDRWVAKKGSRFNRRITATTPMRISGPAAGDPRVGKATAGMLNNCGGGLTPWGTILTAEENFNQYFANNSAVADPAVKAAHARYGIPNGATERKWEKHKDRFDLAKAPNEPFKFGWIVEVDPYDPSSKPIKRTALGRLKHEAAASQLTADGRVAVYSGDDERFECLYKFVSTAKVSKVRAANRNLLDAGTLYVARFGDDGSGTWIPVVFGPDLQAAGFTSQADVLIRLREAAAVLGGTKMDRPEDVEPSPTTKKVYMACTNNTQRGTTGRPGVDPANPRAVNTFGHVIEITESGDDPAATTFSWDILLLCGDPADPSTYFAGFDKSQVSPISCPDNLSFDSSGNLFIATDGAPGTWNGVFSPAPNDAIHVLPVEGPRRGKVQQMLSGVIGCEVASLLVADSDRVLFAAIQHPGEGSSLAAPTSTWPGGTPRSAVVAVTKKGRRIGS
jgi:secreted PhoX family phosphatase